MADLSICLIRCWSILRRNTILSGKVGCNAQEVADTLKMFDM